MIAKTLTIYESIRTAAEREAEPGTGPRSVMGLCVKLCLALFIVNIPILGVVFRSGFFAWVRVTYNFNTVIVPIVLAVASCAACVMWVKGRHSVHALSAGLGILGATLLVALRVWATHIEPTLLQVREVSFASEKIRQPLRIVHFSDTQSAQIGAFERRVFKKIRALEPDLLLFTGDLLQPLPPATWEDELSAMEQLLATLEPPLGFYGVYGDTDGVFLAEGARSTGNMRWLLNRGVTLQRDEDVLRLFGLGNGEAHDASGHLSRELGLWLDQGDDSVLEIVMGHGPNYTLAARRHDIDLSVAGHTHGGQIRLPILGPVITLSEVPRSWARGFREEGRTRINVSAGVGAEHASGLPSIRFNCPPELTIINIVPATGQGD